MHHRAVAILAIICFTFSAGGCALFSQKPNNDYEEVLMPLQTGSVLQRRTYVPRSKAIPKKTEKKQATLPKPKTESAETPPKPVEENTPPADRFR